MYEGSLPLVCYKCGESLKYVNVNGRSFVGGVDAGVVEKVVAKRGILGWKIKGMYLR